jgi:preprotein translocase subunit SecE
MSSTDVETVQTGADKAKLGVSAILLVAGLVAFYALAKQGVYMQWAALIGLLAAAAGVFFMSETGKGLIAYGQESWRELRKVVWPTRKEAGQMTGYVAAFVVVMALFLWLTDKTLEWVLYDLVLRWK